MKVRRAVAWKENGAKKTRMEKTERNRNLDGNAKANVIPAKLIIMQSRTQAHRRIQNVMKMTVKDENANEAKNEVIEIVGIIVQSHLLTIRSIGEMATVQLPHSTSHHYHHHQRSRMFDSAWMHTANEIGTEIET